MAKLSLITVNYRTPQETVAYLNSLAKEKLDDVEVIIVDNASGDGSADLIAAKHPWVKLIRSDVNGGFAAGCALGVAAATAPYLGFINSDCVVHPGAIASLVAYLNEHDDVSVVVPRLLEEDQSVQHNIARLPTLGSTLAEYLLGRVTSWYNPAAFTQPTQVESFSGAALIIRASDYHAAGGFTKRYFMYVEDVELSYQLQRGRKKVLYIPGATITHLGGRSSNANRTKLNQMLHANRIDYIKRHFHPAAAIVAVCAVKIGLVIMRLKYVIKSHLKRSHNR